jgi:hypothetical protein
VPEDDDGLARCRARRDVRDVAPEHPDRHDHAATLRAHASACQEDLCTFEGQIAGLVAPSKGTGRAVSSRRKDQFGGDACRGTKAASN